MTPKLSHASDRATHKARIVEFREVAPSHYQMQLHSPQLAQFAQPGQFVHVLTHPNSDSFGFDPLLRRAFSIMRVGNNKEGNGETIDVLFRVEGKGTKLLAQSQIGDEIDLIGPLGRPFDLSLYDLSLYDLSPYDISNNIGHKLFHVKQPSNQQRTVVVGGGVGVPPLIFLSDVLSKSGVEVEGIIGARTASEVIGWNELNASCQRVSVTTDDGSRGHHGRVTDILADVLNRENEKLPLVVYTCGPLPMLRSVAQMCSSSGVRCQVSMEENMPCGVGVCNGCVVRVLPKKQRSSEHECQEVELEENWSAYNSYRRVCVEGPACWADEIDWEHNNG